MARDALDAILKDGTAIHALSFSDLRDLTGVDVEDAHGAGMLFAWAERRGCKIEISNTLKMVKFVSQSTQ
jgi:hypothetical protein